jgi:hypothetical protein
MPQMPRAALNATNRRNLPDSEEQALAERSPFNFPVAFHPNPCDHCKTSSLTVYRVGGSLSGQWCRKVVADSLPALGVNFA